MKYLTKFDRARTIGVLQGLIDQNSVKQNPNRIPLANTHIEALENAIALLCMYENTLETIREFTELSHYTLNEIEQHFAMPMLENEEKESKTDGK